MIRFCSYRLDTEGRVSLGIMLDWDYRFITIGLIWWAVNIEY